VWNISDLQTVNSDILIYQTEDGTTKIDVRLENETVGLSLSQGEANPAANKGMNKIPLVKNKEKCLQGFL
jgi:hypothetical protein